MLPLCEFVAAKRRSLIKAGTENKTFNDTRPLVLIFATAPNHSYVQARAERDLPALTRME